MTFQTVFDLSQQGYVPDKGILVGPILSAVGAVLVFGPVSLQTKIFRRPPGRAQRAFSWFYFLFMLFVATITVSVSIGGYWMDSSRLNSGVAPVVEGPVTDLVPGEFDKGVERFSVQGRRFFYSEYEMTPGFHKTKYHGGPIRAGLPVRVTYLGNDILRLEVGE